VSVSAFAGAAEISAGWFFSIGAAEHAWAAPRAAAERARAGVPESLPENGTQSVRRGLYTLQRVQPRCSGAAEGVISANIDLPQHLQQVSQRS